MPSPEEMDRMSPSDRATLFAIEQNLESIEDEKERLAEIESEIATFSDQVGAENIIAALNEKKMTLEGTISEKDQETAGVENTQEDLEKKRKERMELEREIGPELAAGQDDYVDQKKAKKLRQLREELHIAA